MAGFINLSKTRCIGSSKSLAVVMYLSICYSCAVGLVGGLAAPKPWVAGSKCSEVLLVLKGDRNIVCL